MVVVPLPNPAAHKQDAPGSAHTESNQWLRYAAGGSLIAGALLLVTGKYRAGMLAAAAGTALAAIDQQDIIHEWWTALPTLADDAGRILNQVQGVVETFDAQREKLHALVHRPSSASVNPPA
jgi:hypothetical protein